MTMCKECHAAGHRFLDGCELCAVRAAVAAEREACARLVEAWDQWRGNPICEERLCGDIAEAIRARGQPVPDPLPKLGAVSSQVVAEPAPAREEPLGEYAATLALTIRALEAGRKLAKEYEEDDELSVDKPARHVIRLADRVLSRLREHGAYPSPKPESVDTSAPRVDAVTPYAEERARMLLESARAQAESFLQRALRAEAALEKADEEITELLRRAAPPDAVKLAIEALERVRDSGVCGRSTCKLTDRALAALRGGR